MARVVLTEPNPFKTIEHSLGAGFGVEHVYELPFIKEDTTAKKVVSYITNRTLYSNKTIEVIGDASWRNVRKNHIVTLSIPRRNITEVTYIVHAISTNFQGQYNVTLRPYSDDIYDDVVLTAPTAWTPRVGYGSLYEVPYVTVSPTLGEGMFSTIEDALANLPSWARRIVLLRGTHPAPTLTNSYTLSTLQDLEIIGESNDESIVENNSGYDCFTITDSDKKYRFANFTINSQNLATDSYMIFVSGSTTADNLSRVRVEDMIFNLVHEDDIAVRAYGGEGRLVVKNCEANGTGTGTGWFVSVVSYKNVRVINNYCNLLYVGIIVFDSSGIWINHNNIQYFKYYGIYAGGTSATDQVHVNGNTMRGTAGDGDDEWGITVSKGERCEVMSNIVVMNQTSGDGKWGIGIMTCIDGVVSNNVVRLGNSADPSNNYGIVLSASLRNVIQGNSIDMRWNRNTGTAKDYGILLDSTSDNNQGGDNITYRAGIDLSDGGTGNAITYQAV